MQILTPFLIQLALLIGSRHFCVFKKTAKSYKKKKNHGKSRGFYGCGGRTRTYDLRVMSPTSFQLLYSAILGRTPECLGIITRQPLFVKCHFADRIRHTSLVPSVRIIGRIFW